MVPSGASPCSVGTQCAKPQFPPNAPLPGREMQKKQGFSYHLNSSVSCFAGRRLGSNYTSSMRLSVRLEPLGVGSWELRDIGSKRKLHTQLSSSWTDSKAGLPITHSPIPHPSVGACLTSTCICEHPRWQPKHARAPAFI